VTDQIPTEGRFDPRTHAMITAWQKSQGLLEIGFLGESQLIAFLEKVTPAKRPRETEFDARQQAERAESGLQLSEQDRKRVQVALNSLGHEIPTATGFLDYPIHLPATVGTDFLAGRGG
jgi:hypothetical protein